MMDISHITALLLQYKYLIMYILMFLEGPTVGFISAFLAAQGHFNFGIVYLLSILGDATSDILWYRIGRFCAYLGVRNMARGGITRWIGRKIQWIQKQSFFGYIQRNVQKRFFSTLLVVKITAPISVPGQFTFGFIKLPFRKVALQTTLVCFLFESVFLNLGYFSSLSIETFKSRFDQVTTIISMIVIGLLALWIGFYIIKRFRNISKRLK